MLPRCCAAGRSREVGTLERTETLTHRIGVGGRVTVKSVTGSIRIRGIEGEDARLTVTYRIRATDEASAERILDGGRVLVDRGPGSIEVETPERRLSTGIAWLFGGARVGADVVLEIPWGATVRLETVNGTIEAVAMVGEQKYRAVSGEIHLWNVAGSVDAGTLSGSIWLDGGGDIRIRANTVSGSIRVRAARIHGMVLSTTSGAIAVTGALDPAGDHRAESISGSVELSPLSGVTAELRSISGSLVSDVASRTDGGRGFWRSVVGDGKATFRASSTSGGLRITAAVPGAAASGSPWRSAPVPPVAPEPPIQPTPPAPASSWDPAPAEPDATFETAPAGSAEPEVVPAPDGSSEEELSVLRALERGEIDVDQATERLEIIRGQAHV
jgi:hypothetical protein